MRILHALSQKRVVPESTKRGVSSCSSHDLARLVELQSRVPRMELRRIAVADVDEEVRLVAAIGKEIRVHSSVVEAGHRPRVQSKSASGNDEVRALQG